MFGKALVFFVVQFSCFERLLASDHGVKTHSYGKNVYWSASIRIKIFRHFRSFEADSATICSLVNSILLILIFFRRCSKSKVSQFQIIVAIKQAIQRLDISMSDSAFVQKVETLKKLTNEISCILLLEVLVLL